MKIFITGGTGFVGTSLVKRLTDEGHWVTVLTRSSPKGRPAFKNVSFVQGDPLTPGLWQEQVSGHDVVINLAGASIFSLWTNGRKQLIRDSRILTTQNLVNALSHLKGKKPVFISTSAVGYYGSHEHQILDETSPPANDFLGQLGQAWESAAQKAEKYGVRVVICRFGIVLGSEGGALSKMALPVKWFVGSPMGNGRQWFSWIHEKDLVEIFMFLIQQKSISGPINCTAPNPVTNREMTQALAKTLHRPLLFPPIPAFVLKLVLGEFSTTLVKGQRVVPERLLAEGYKFQFPNIHEALDDLLKQNKNQSLNS